MISKRKRTAAAVLAAAGALTATQLGLAGSASAATTGCPINLVYTSKFYLNGDHWVKGSGLYFGLKNTSSKSYKNVYFNVTDVKYVRFGNAYPSGGSISRKSAYTATVHTGTLKGKASLGMHIHTHLLNTSHYQVKFSVYGSGWSCAVKQGTWGRG